MAIGLEIRNWDAKQNHGGNIRKLKKCAIPNTLRLEPSCSNTQDLPTASSTTAIDTYEQMEHVPHHKAVETLSRNTKLSSSTDPLTEVSMSWSNRSGNRSEVNTKMSQTTMRYTIDSMNQALQAVNNDVPIRTAAKQLGVPKNKSRGDFPLVCRNGPPTNLSQEEENALVKWLLIGDRGFPATKTQLMDSVEMIMKTTKKTNSFQNARPGRKWYKCFMKRHTIIVEIISQNLTASRSSVTKEKIRSWFSEILQYIDTEGLTEVFQDPKRV
ncbi:hypothetical protein JTB14_033572 [Gonioctena quinquepunctata]|nr:hypothetical protein JTB14_033572 [Gonioctena quinquepunctata]